MLRAIHLRSFKKHRGTSVIPTAPITLLLGGNSAGKSSVMQAILALKQSEDLADGSFSALRTDGRHVRLGRASNVMTYGNPDARFGIALTGDASGSGISWTVDLEYGPNESRPGLADLRAMRLRVGARELRSAPVPSAKADLSRSGTMLRWSEYFDGETPDLAWAQATASLQAAPHGDEDEDGIHVARLAPWDSAPWAATTTWNAGVRQSEWQAGIPEGTPQIGSTLAAIEYLRTCLRGVRHVGPVRQAGQRTYELDLDGPDEVGSTGWNLASQLARQDISRVNQMLEELDLGMVLERSNLSTLSDVADYRFRGPTTGGAPVGIGDVGFGMSQILPILVEWAGCERRAGDNGEPQLMMVEQPELHLHPQLQVDLVQRILVHAIVKRESTRESSDASPLAVMLETHSETIVRAIQHMVRLGQLDRASVSIVSFDQDPATDEVRVTQIPLTKSGAFARAWPQGFFPQNMRLRW